MIPCLASLDPARLFDELTTRLGDFLLDAVPRLLGILRGLTKLPAGAQVLLVMGALLVLVLGYLGMRRAFVDAAAIRREARQARDRSREARAELAVRDRRKAMGYLMLVGVAVVAALLAIFVYQTVVQAAAPVGR